MCVADASHPFEGDTLTLLRESRVDVGAPSKVKKSKEFRVDGFLERADWNQREYVTVDYGKVRLESKPSGGTWKTIKTLKIGRGVREGALQYNSVKIKKAMCFRRVHDGSSTTAAVASDRDCVKIRK